MIWIVLWLCLVMFLFFGAMVVYWIEDWSTDWPYDRRRIAVMCLAWPVVPFWYFVKSIVKGVER